MYFSCVGPSVGLLPTLMAAGYSRKSMTALPAYTPSAGTICSAGAFSAWIPGSASGALAVLLEAGLRLEDFPALVCWDRPFADFERYVPITLAVL